MGYDFRFSDADPQEPDAQVLPVYGPGPRRLSIEGRSRLAKLDFVGAPGRSEDTSEDLCSAEPRGEAILELDGVRHRVFLATRGDVTFVHLRGRVHRIEAINALDRARQNASPSGGQEDMRAPMPGTVVSVAVEAGADVDPGQLLLTIESMKLQTAVTAPHAGRVAEICVAAGANFDQGDVLVRLEAPLAPETAAADTPAPPREEDDQGVPL